MDSARPGLRCRRIDAADLDAVRGLLVEGFPTRPSAYWQRAIERLAAHRGPPALPRYGYLLEADGNVVGVLLMIPSAAPGSGTPRCHLSSWYVEPRFRGYASLLVQAATRAREITYVNISPDAHTRTTNEALGFELYSEGVFIGLPWLALTSRRVEILRASARADLLPGSREAERELVRAHAELGCVAFWCVSEGTAHPFVFVPRQPVKGLIPCAQLVYCRETRAVATFARAIGRHLLARGYAAIAVDATGPIAGLAGRFVEGQGPRYFKGPDRPRLGDLAFSEIVLFGI